jgi:bacterioferritin
VLYKLLIGETVQDILNCDLRVEQQAISQLCEAIAHAESVRDFVSRDLFAKILEDEEAQIDFIETQLELIPKIGIENFIRLQSTPAG